MISDNNLGLPLWYTLPISDDIPTLPIRFENLRFPGFQPGREKRINLYKICLLLKQILPVKKSMST